MAPETTSLTFMDTTRFKEGKTGKLLPIKTPMRQDHAVVPDKLPPNWKFPESLWPKLAEAKESLGRLDGIGRTLPDPELLLSPLKRREALASSRIEGTYATAEELMLFEIDQQESKSKMTQAQQSWREVFNYSTALARGAKRLQESPFCGKLIKELQKVLMHGVRGQLPASREWREHQVAVGSDRRYIPPPRNEMLECIDELERYVSQPNPSYDPLVRAYIVHYQFEAIHPFADGNGRIGRVLLSLMIAKWCNLTRPWLYMSAFFERYKDEYINNLFRISTEGAWDKWIEFCLNGTTQQANDAIRRCEQLGLIRNEMLEKSSRYGSPRTERIIHGLFSNPFVRVCDLHKKLDVSYPTAQSDVDRLVKADILQPLPEVHPKSYYAPQIFTVAYSEADEFGTAVSDSREMVS